MNYSETVYLGTPGTVTINGNAPFTLSIIPTNINVPNKIREIYYNYNDGTSDQQILFPANSANYVNLPFPLEPGDPRNYNKSKTFYTEKKLTSYTTTVSVFQFSSSTPSIYNIDLNLSAPYLENISEGDGYFESLHLRSTRMYGVDNKILYVFESSNPNYLLPVNVDWTLRPQARAAEAQAISSYRSYKLLQPYENELTTSIDTVTHIYSTDGVEALPNPDPGIAWDVDALIYFNGVQNLTESNKLIINNFVLQCKLAGLWNNMMCWPMRQNQNFGSGINVYSLGGLAGVGGANGVLATTSPTPLPTWSSDGITFSGYANVAGIAQPQNDMYSTPFKFDNRNCTHYAIINTDFANKDPLEPGGQIIMSTLPSTNNPVYNFPRRVAFLRETLNLPYANRYGEILSPYFDVPPYVTQRAQYTGPLANGDNNNWAGVGMSWSPGSQLYSRNGGNISTGNLTNDPVFPYISEDHRVEVSGIQRNDVGALKGTCAAAFVFNKYLTQQEHANLYTVYKSTLGIGLGLP